MIINRVWAMPFKWTFEIKPIAELLARYVGDGKGWIDPFAGWNSPAEFTNDLNPICPAQFHMKALEYVSRIKWEYKGALFDPPYSLRQVKECYDGLGQELTYAESKDASFSAVKDILGNNIKADGLVISFGWNSNGFGKNRGFEIIEILLVPHGGHHNDTIVTVEIKRQSKLL